MIRWYELVLDILAVALVSVGVGLISLPFGFIAAGVCLVLLSVGIKTRRGTDTSGYVAREVER